MVHSKHNKKKWKIVLFSFVALIALASLLYTNFLVKKLSVSERTRAEAWAMTTRGILTMPDTDDEFISFLYAMRDSLSLPAIIADENDEVVFWRGLDTTKTHVKPSANTEENAQVKYDPAYFKKELRKMKKQHAPILLTLDGGEEWRVYYKDSFALTLLRIFPYIQLSLIAIFLILAYSVFVSITRSEQNLVWVGMAKETAHQLGTPISSLMGWLELVRMKYDEEEDDSVLNEMERDIKRLEIVADRFSKIGSKPDLTLHVVYDVLEDFVNYFKIRVSEKISFSLEGDREAKAFLNVQLFEWIMENLLKNAVNAIEMEGKVAIHISLNPMKDEMCIDIQDTGKGLAKSNYETIFEPGYTTRKRGWGLGLSLTKRMINYHKGQVFVRESELGKGTTFRIILKTKLKNPVRQKNNREIV